MYDFDKIIDTTGTHRMKYSNPPEGAPADTIPMWIADMDFPAPQEIVDAVTERAQHGMGFYVKKFSDFGMYNKVWLGFVFMVIVMVIVMQLFEKLKDRLLRWTIN